MSTPTVALVGALDTKAEEYGFVRDRLAGAGVDSVLVDVCVLDEPRIAADIVRETVAEAAGTTVAALAKRADRNHAMGEMARGAATVVSQLVSDGEVSGVLVLGGSNAGYVMSQVSAALPIGVPKLLVSTIVAGDTRPYVGSSDLTMMYPVVDIAGLNSVSRMILARAADACAGMVTGPALPAATATSDVVACTMFGVTTTCIQAVQQRLLDQGSEVHVFHATGVGGRGMEGMIRSGLFTAVADLTTTELVDDLVGGVCSAGPDRLTAAASCGVPQVVSTGALDMVNFGAADTVPGPFADRQLFAHNPAVTLMRTNVAENAEVGRRMASKLNAARAPVEVHVPAAGFSQISVSGAPFHDPEADAALVAALREHLAPHISLHVHDAAINDPDFSAEVGRALTRVLDQHRRDHQQEGSP